MTLAPRKTSLWSSSLLGNHVALGCDKKILYSSDLSRAEMSSLNTGSAVFAMEQQEQELLAGTRSGHVRAYDLRVAHDQERSSKSEVCQADDFHESGADRAIVDPSSAADIDYSSSPALRALTTCRSHGWVSYQFPQRHSIWLTQTYIDRTISIFDRRFLPARTEPVQQLSGHINTTSVYLGCNIWPSSILALAGEDKKVRIWSLKTGRQLEAVKGYQQSLLATTFEERVPEIRLRQTGSELELWLADGSVLSRYTVEYSGHL
jgi:WD40 repeat protein